MKDYPYRLPTLHPGFEEVQEFVNQTMSELSAVLPYSEEYKGLDFTNSRISIAVNIEIIDVNGLYLAAKRSNKNGSYVGKWDNIAGHMTGSGRDPIFSCMVGELKEEIGLELPFCAEVRIGEIITVDRANGAIIYIIPAQVKLLETHDVVLNDEHTEFVWCTHEERMQLDLVPIVPRVREHFAEIERRLASIDALDISSLGL